MMCEIMDLASSECPVGELEGRIHDLELDLDDANRKILELETERQDLANQAKRIAKEVLNDLESAKWELRELLGQL
jgi:hypothetical protein